MSIQALHLTGAAALVSRGSLRPERPRQVSLVVRRQRHSWLQNITAPVAATPDLNWPRIAIWVHRRGRILGPHHMRNGTATPLTMFATAAVLSLETMTIRVQLFRARSTSIGKNGLQTAASGFIHRGARQIGTCRGS
jgi:hypothetical protein